MKKSDQNISTDPKSKKQALPLISDLHGVTEMSLERAHERIAHLSTIDDRLQVRTHHLDPDSIIFQVAYYRREHHRLASVTGRLRRWEGTRTRIDADSVTYAPGAMAEMAYFMLLAVPLGLIIASGLLFISIGIIIPYGPYYNPAIVPFILLFSWGLAIILIRWIDPEPFLERQYRARRALDTTLQAVVDAIVEPESQFRLVEDDDDLSRLLRGDHFEQLILGDDGELPDQAKR